MFDIFRHWEWVGNEKVILVDVAVFGFGRYRVTFRNCTRHPNCKDRYVHLLIHDEHSHPPCLLAEYELGSKKTTRSQ